MDVEHSNDPSQLGAAVILCQVGKGRALLTGPHPEFVPRLLQKTSDHEYNKAIVDVLIDHDKDRLEFMRDILTKAGLHCNNDFADRLAPSLTPLLLLAPNNSNLIDEFERNLDGQRSKVVDGTTVLEDDADTFQVYKGFKTYKAASTPLLHQEPDEVVKTVVVASENEKYPPSEVTPNFSAVKYFQHLNPQNSVGSMLLYGEILTSTSSLLNNNKKFLSLFPNNSVLHVGTLQVSGRGRGGNIWINPKGVSASTACVNLPLKSPTTGRPISIVFVQYLAMLAYCKAILGYGPGYEDLPVRIKWPNDLYAMKPDYYHTRKIRLLGKGLQGSTVPLTDLEPAFVKVSGLLVNTNFINNSYSLLLGCGLNVSHDGPTTSLNSWVKLLNKEREQARMTLLPLIEVEKLQALYMNNLDTILKKFVNNGPEEILPDYYDLWLHNNQIVTLTDHNNIRAKIVGITKDYGLLIAKELVTGTNTQFTGNTYHLQPDGNTFEIFKGLISKKVI